MSGNLIHSSVEEVTVLPVEEEINETLLKEPALACEICNVKVTSSKILQRHLEGRKHKVRLERKGKCYRCEFCDITANSETQLNIHLNSSKHKTRLVRKEDAEFSDNMSCSSIGLWVLGVGATFIFVNLCLLFNNYSQNDLL